MAIGAATADLAIGWKAYFDAHTGEELGRFPSPAAHRTVSVRGDYLCTYDGKQIVLYAVEP